MLAQDTEQERTRSAGRLSVVVVGTVPEPTEAEATTTAEPWQGQFVGLLVLRYLRQRMLRLTRLVTRGTHPGIMTHPGGPRGVMTTDGR